MQAGDSYDGGLMRTLLQCAELGILTKKETEYGK